MKFALSGLAVATAVASLALPVAGFTVSSPGGVALRWPTSRSVVLKMQLGATPFDAFIDGSTTWNTVGSEAAATWNARADVNLVVSASDDRAVGEANGVNDVFFERGSYGGQGFGDALGITVSFSREDGTFTETDVVFDSSRPWNSYRGQLRPYSGGGTLYDFRRVAIHEFGHVLGLDHPDAVGQSVGAIMNSRISDLDDVQQDDVNGLISIYGPHTVTADRLVAGSTMRGGQWLTSQNGRYRLYMQGDSNLVVYDMSRGGPPGEALWWTGASADNGQAIFQSDGNFVVYDGTGTAIWNTVTHGNPGAFMVLQNDGNLVLYSAAGEPLWTRMQ
ncbi:MAG: matrixin family metalloprotease [Vicinamibacterales bacterium]